MVDVGPIHVPPRPEPELRPQPWLEVEHRRGRPRAPLQAQQTSVRRAHVLLRAGIRSGALRADDPLVEADVAEMLSTSRNAVRQALQLLVQEGLVTRGRRHGTNVVRGIVRVALDQRTDNPDRYDGEHDRLEGQPDPLADVPRFVAELLECQVVRASPYLREQLELEGDDVWMGEHLVIARDEPVSVCVTYTPVAAGARHLHLQLRGAERFQARFGLPFGWADDTLEAVACEGRTAKLLGVEEGSPILLRETVGHAADGRPQELTYKYNRGDRVSVFATTRLAECASGPSGRGPRRPTG